MITGYSSTFIITLFPDTLQTFIMLIGGVVLTYVSLHEVGGYSMLMAQYANATAQLWPGVGFNESMLKCAQPAKVSLDVVIWSCSCDSSNDFAIIFVHLCFSPSPQKFTSSLSTFLLLIPLVHFCLPSVPLTSSLPPFTQLLTTTSLTYFV